MSCIFCRIIAKEVPSQVIAEAPDWIAIRDVAAQAPHHALVIPRRHLSGLPACGAPEEALLGALLRGAADVGRTLDPAGAGYRVVVNSGEEGGQTVPHLHLHVLAGRRMGWPPG
jgi:histidine triad (HIT) family protein